MTYWIIECSEIKKMNATVISILIRTPVQCAKSLEEDACMAPDVRVAKWI